VTVNHQVVETTAMVRPRRRAIIRRRINRRLTCSHVVFGISDIAPLERSHNITNVNSLCQNDSSCRLQDHVQFNGQLVRGTRVRRRTVANRVIGFVPIRRLGIEVQPYAGLTVCRRRPWNRPIAFKLVKVTHVSRHGVTPPIDGQRGRDIPWPRTIVRRTLQHSQCGLEL